MMDTPNDGNSTSRYTFWHSVHVGHQWKHRYKNQELKISGGTLGFWDFDAASPRTATGLRLCRKKLWRIISCLSDAKHQSHDGPWIPRLFTRFTIFSYVFKLEIFCGFLDVHSFIETAFECILGLAHPNLSPFGKDVAWLVRFLD